MKKVLLAACIFLSVAQPAGAQTGQSPATIPPAKLKAGKVVYERTIQLQLRLQGMDEEMARQLPRSRTDHFELLFANNQTLWQHLPSAEEEANTFTSGGGGNVVRFSMGGSEAVVFHNLETGKRTDQRELNSKTYIVDDSIRKLAWKLTDETKPILGYTARKAVAQRYDTRTRMVMENGEMKREQVPDTIPVVAWFTPDIPVAAGPELQGQLPGMILELDMNNGRTRYQAVEISPKVNTGTVKEPKGGKRITAQEFARENEKMYEEMRRNMPAGRTIMIGG